MVNCVSPDVDHNGAGNNPIEDVLFSNDIAHRHNNSNNSLPGLQNVQLKPYFKKKNKIKRIDTDNFLHCKNEKTKCIK